VKNGDRRQEEATKKVKTSTRANKRGLFAEISEGMEELAKARKGKRTLRTHVVEYRPPPELRPADLVRIREKL